MLHHLLQCAVAWGAKAAPPQQPPPPTLPDSLIDSVLFKLLLFNVGMVTLLKLYSLSTGMRPGSYQAPAPSDIVSYSPGEQMFVTDPKGEAVVRVAKTGVASLEPSTVPKVFKMAAANFPDAPALMVERNGAWLQWSWCQYYNESCAMAKSLLALGFAPHDSVNVIGFNSPEWVIAQMAANLAGGKAAGVYTTNEPAACRYIAEHSEAVVIFVEDEKQLAKYAADFLPKAGLPKLKALVMWKGEVPKDFSASKGVRVMTWKNMLGQGEVSGISDATLDVRASTVKPGHCCTLIYTSGTTGNPKAVMISHDNMLYEAYSSCESLFGGLGLATSALPTQLRIVSYLPLSHVAAQMLDLAGPLLVTAVGNGWGPAAFGQIHYTTWFARPDALKGTLKDTLKAARPTVFLGVPRVWEKMREALLEIGRKNTGLKAKLSAWAKRTAAAAARERQLGGSGHQTLQYLVAKKLLGKVKEGLGLDQSLSNLTAAAPMPRDVAEYFASVDIDILDVYGMSECTGATTISTALVHQFGTVGPAVVPAQIKIDNDPARDNPGEGEICYRGRHIMMGYMKEEAKTREAIDAEGWLHSGDVGLLDNDGLLHITGRIKELIITAGGENIAPVPIEDKLKELCPAVSNMMMVGDKRKYNVCILTLKTQLDPETGVSTGKLVGDAARVSDAKTDLEAIKESKVKGSKWEAYLSNGIKELNEKHSVSNAQRIQKFAVVEKDFSEKGGELTATLKLKRSVAAEKYAKVIDAMY